MRTVPGLRRRGFLALMARAAGAFGLAAGGIVRSRPAAAAPEVPPNPRIPLDRVREPWSAAEFTFYKLVEDRRGPVVSDFPGYLIRLPKETPGHAETRDGLYAVSRVCPHEGCRFHLFRPGEEIPFGLPDGVPRSIPNPLLVCPCHRSAFDPAHAGRVMGGPAPRPPYRFEFRIEDGVAVILALERGGDRFG
ncbi:MAG TPA: Rieske 2Fe-2S domain-containing protein [Alphaproteobacteria bacterium]